ncbi:hypothetical protein D9V86_03130, partial [Bacteroidetes/Chlorobi group bacterium ChocPot_Mid]
MNTKSKFIETVNKLSDLKYIDDLDKLIESGKKDITIKNLVGSLGSLTIAGLCNRKKRNYFIITFSNKEAEEWHHNLSLFIDENKIALLTAPQKDSKFEVETLDQRYIWLIEGLDKIRKNEYVIVITTPEIFDIKLPRQTNFKNNTKTIYRGEKVNFLEFTQGLILNGFDKKDFVSGQGDISIRGGIVDFYPLGWSNPLRIEFWGDEIESIREFDPISQRSIQHHDSIDFFETVFESERDLFDSNIMEYFSDDTIFVLDSPEMLISEYKTNNLPHFNITLNLNKFGNADININSNEQPKFHGSVSKLVKEIIKLFQSNTKLILCAEGKIHSERFQELVESRIDDILKNNTDLNDDFEEIHPTLSGYHNFSADAIKKQIVWLDETVSDGFILPEYKFAIFTEHQVFDRARFQIYRTKKHISGISLQELNQLNIGDYVVHLDKGIAKFNGFHKVTMGGSLQDCVKLVFAEGDILYITLNYINKIQKYSSQEGVEPKLSKLGTREWIKKK